MIKKKSIGTACLILGLLAMFLVLTWVRVYVGSRQAYGKGMGFLERRETVRAITYFDRSLHWYAPLNPYVERSAQRLWEIGTRAQEQGDTKMALIAFQSIRQGFYAARSLWTPGKDWILKCDAKINDLANGRARGGAEPPGHDQGVIGPSIFWSLVVVVSLLGWVGSVIGFIVIGMGAKGRFRYENSRALLWMALFMSFFAVWVLAMMKA